MWALFLAQRLAAETAQRRLQSELHDLRHACDVEMHALRRQHQIAEDKLQREVLARQAAEQELLHAKRAQESADEAAAGGGLSIRIAPSISAFTEAEWNGFSGASRLVEIQMLLVSRYSRIDSMPLSRPRPERFMPPNGIM